MFKNKFKNKKAVVVAIVLAVLFVGGIGIGVVSSLNNHKNIPVVDIENDTEYDTLIADIEYQVPKKELIKDNDKIIAKFNIVSKDINSDNVKEISKKFYELTLSKQKGLDGVEVSVYDEGGNEISDEFYADGLGYKVVYDHSYNSVTLYDYDEVSVEKSVTKTDWTINDVHEEDGNIVKIDIAMADGVSKEDVMAQSKGLIDQIQTLNPDKQIEVAEANISTSSDTGFAYNTKFADIIVTTQKSNIN